MPSSSPWRLQVFDELPSTSDHVRAAAQAGEPERLAVMARLQTAGRGRSGRVWQCSTGNLALSLLLRPDEALREAGQWALLAGLALAEALDAEPGGRLALKWPNDLLCDGAKLGGILVDAEAGAGGRLAWLVIGIGVNLAQAPDVEGRAVASLEGAIAPETLAWRIMERVSALCDLRRTSGFAPIRAAWTRLALPAGTAMTVKLAGGEVAGRFVGLNEAGNLLLATPDGGTRAIVAGEVWTPGAKEALTC